ncbi:hypothetical protein CLHUN_02860 [Ruminiclostridium hungatei]|uniref:Uncharacterized protein n=1 Tax=Ruminiclostridium hungatei TaxID=48256 RepID=A0A1V4ST97_RUMHU|nr:hypothetical protein CLHUN_02860 [Ruminiclostridium hungatei]
MIIIIIEFEKSILLNIPPTCYIKGYFDYLSLIFTPPALSAVML